MQIRSFFLVPALLAALALDASASEKAGVDDATRKAVLAELGARVKAEYVFPDKAELIAERLEAQEKRGAYRAAKSLDQLAGMLTDDLRQPTNDRHLGVRYSVQPVPEIVNGPARSPEMERMLENDLKARNYGIHKVDILPGNIGYIDLRSFPSARFARPALSAAMNQVADTDALIIDLRYNGGGDPHAVAYLSSYLFDRRTHLNDMVWRSSGRTEAFWTTEDLPGKKFGSTKKVYVLTSKETFSGAEEFSYNLKQLKRALIVGEATGGGAHPGRIHRIHPHLTVFIPNGRAINPVSRTNWEGTGVAPDVKVTAPDALRTAERLALTELLKSARDDAQAQLLRQRLGALP